MDVGREKDHLGFDISRSMIINRQNIGHIGRISNDWIQSLGLDLENAYGFELDLEPIKQMFGRKKTFSTVNPYPKITRDLNLVMPQDQEVGSIVEIFHKIGKKLITEANPVNIFLDDETLGEAMKSVTFSIKFQNPSKTLEDKDVNPIIDEIIRVAEKDFNAKLRS